MSEFHDEYSESLDAEFRKLEDALLSDEVRLLAPSEPIRLAADASVADAVTRMVDNRRAGGVIVDAGGRLIGIFTERDLLTRVVHPGRDLGRTRLTDVMTPDPEALALDAHARLAHAIAPAREARARDDRVCSGVHLIHAAGSRSVPLVDAEHRPIGIVTVNDVMGGLARIFPEATLKPRAGAPVNRRG